MATNPESSAARTQGPGAGLVDLSAESLSGLRGSSESVLSNAIRRAAEECTAGQPVSSGFNNSLGSAR